jgi:hypothetical protein
MTEATVKYLAAFFKSVSHVIYAERLLKEAHVLNKIIPVPKKISSDCGVCIRFLPEKRDALESTVKGKVEGYIIQPL